MNREEFERIIETFKKNEAKRRLCSVADWNKSWSGLFSQETLDDKWIDELCEDIEQRGLN